jgi:hypothetical protein
LHIQNGSSQSAYQVIASLVAIQGAFRNDGRNLIGDQDPMFFRFPLGQLPPGLTSLRPGWDGISALLVRHGVELAFQDAAGRYWRRMGSEELEAIPVSPVDFYDVGPIVDWHGPSEGD